MQFTFKQKIFALLVASLFLRFAFFAVEAVLALKPKYDEAHSRPSCFSGGLPDGWNVPPSKQRSDNPEELAERIVTAFHTNLVLNNHAATYASFTSSYRKQISESDFSAAMNRLKSELGAFEYGVKYGQTIRPTGTGMDQYEVSLSYETVFNNGSIDEYFIVEIQNGKAALKDYRNYDASNGCSQ